MRKKNETCSRCLDGQGDGRLRDMQPPASGRTLVFRTEILWLVLSVAIVAMYWWIFCFGHVDSATALFFIFFLTSCCDIHKS